MKTALLDADIIAFKAACWHEKQAEGEIDGLAEAVCRGALETAERWLEGSGCQQGICCLSSPQNFRRIVYPRYKAHREGQLVPKFLMEAKEALAAEWDSLTIDYLEADDVMGILATKPDTRYTIVTIDKDLLQVPGHHYNPDKNKHEYVSENTGRTRFYEQWLMGDATDNIPGIRGVGPKKAHKMVREAIERALGRPEMNFWSLVEQAVLAFFIDAGVPEEEAYRQRACIRILQYSDEYVVGNRADERMMG